MIIEVFFQKYSIAKRHKNFLQLILNVNLQIQKNVIEGFTINLKTTSKIYYSFRGEIYDVAVDIRKNSPTFGKILQIF